MSSPRGCNARWRLSPRPCISFRRFAETSIGARRIATLAGLEKYRSVGAEVVEEAFTSTSRSALKMYGGNVLFYVISKRGRDISRWSAHPEEEEVLFQRGSRFKVLAFTESEGDVEIFLEEI